MRTCRDCKETKEAEFFVQGRRNICKACWAKAQREWRKQNPGKYSSYSKKWRAANPTLQASSSKNWRSKNPDYHRNYNLVRRYDLTLDEYSDMAQIQSGCCAICGVETQLYVDHNHITDTVRELLCDLCNKGLGHFKESPEALRKAAVYLEKHQTV